MLEMLIGGFGIGAIILLIMLCISPGNCLHCGKRVYPVFFKLDSAGYCKDCRFGKDRK